MSDPDKDLPDEQQLDEYLKGGSSVSQQYRQLRNAEVPAELDRLVLRQAQEAVKSTRPAKSRTWMRWSAPLALAASAVLVVSIVIESGVQDGEMLTSEPASAPAPTMEAKRKSEAAENDMSASAPVEARMPVPEERAPAAPQRDEAPAYVIVPEAPAPVAVPPPPPKVDAPSPAELRRERRVAQPPSQSATTQSASNSSPPEAMVNAEAFTQAQHALASHKTLQSMPEEFEEAADTRETVSAPVADAAVAGAAAEREMSEKSRQYSDPELWLRDIRQLRKENKQADADREWRRFREKFPDYVVQESDIAREVR